LRLVTLGRSSQQIADELVIDTAIRRVSNILRKTDTSTRAEAAAYTTRRGLT
jgi:DNA-binding NarL/FixJ family response regulator